MLARLRSVGLLAYNVTAIKTVPGHSPPRKEDNPAGRYAGSLFSAASQKEQLDVVQEDLEKLKEVIKVSEGFNRFLADISVQKSKQKEFIEQTVSSSLSPISKNFINLLIDTGRLSDLPKIIDKYREYVSILSMQEDIRIISAKPLSQGQRKQVEAALSKGRPGVSFKVDYEIDSTIQGGLQAYSGSTFLDCSLRSRMERLKTQLQKL